MTWIKEMGIHTRAIIIFIGIQGLLACCYLTRRSMKSGAMNLLLQVPPYPREMQSENWPLLIRNLLQVNPRYFIILQKCIRGYLRRNNGSNSSIYYVGQYPGV